MVHVVFPRWPEWGLQRVFFHRFAPLSVMVLGALVRREGWRALVIDENVEPIPTARPDLVFLTSWTSHAPHAYRLADAYRERGIPVVMGGVHPSILPGEALLHADAVVAGEAEAVLADVLADAAAGQLKPYYHGEWQDMSTAPTVAEFEVDYRSWKLGRYQPTHSLQTTRGCRFNCEFCSVIRINGRGSRHMSPDAVVEDLRRRGSIPPRSPLPVFVYLADDDLGSDLDYSSDLFDAIIRSGVKVRWAAQTSIGIADHPDILAAAHASGCRLLFIGFESVSRDSLKEANKRNRPDRYAQSIAAIHDAGIAVEGSLIFGFDEDGPGVFKETVETIDAIGMDSAHFGILTPFPGTTTFARMYEDDRIFDFDWSHYTYHRCVIEPARMSTTQLEQGLLEAYRDFYSRPRRLRRARADLGRRNPLYAFGHYLVNRSYERLGEPRLLIDEPTYIPPLNELQRLVTTSRADATQALLVAGAQLRDGGVPVQLGARPT